MGLLSLFGLSLMWSPMFGTSEALVFPALSAYPNALLLSRICNLAAFGIVMGALSIANNRARDLSLNRAILAAIVGTGCIGTLVGAFTGMGLLPLPCLAVGAFMRGVFYGMLTIFWIDVLIHLDDGVIGVAVSAALALYAVVGLIVLGASLIHPALAALLLTVCPALSCLGCMKAGESGTMEAPVDQESAQAPLRTRLLLFAANFLFGIMLGALLYYFARFDDTASVLAFLAMSILLLAVFSFGAIRLGVSMVYRGFMMCFAIGVSLLLLAGRLNHVIATLVASAMLAFLILYTIVIFTDTQARMREPYWKVPGMCQVFASLGMIAAAALFQTVFPNGEVPDTQLVLLATACMVFVAGVFSPSDRARTRPWGFSSLIPAESPEARAMRRCGELAEECGLTSRELEVLQKLASGMTKDEIAEALYISPATAKTHIRNIYSKLDVHSQRELSSKIDL